MAILDWEKDASTPLHLAIFDAHGNRLPEMYRVNTVTGEADIVVFDSIGNRVCHFSGEPVRVMVRYSTPIRVEREL